MIIIPGITKAAKLDSYELRRLAQLLIDVEGKAGRAYSSSCLPKNIAAVWVRVS